MRTIIKTIITTAIMLAMSSPVMIHEQTQAYRPVIITRMPTEAPTATPTITNTPVPTEAPCEALCEVTEAVLYPSDDDVLYMAKVIHGEAGICSDLQKSAVAWCVLNRVDCDEYPNTIIEVITQPHQFKGYADDKRPTADEIALAWDVIYRWLNDLDGRTLPRKYLFFHAERGKNVFTTNHLKGTVWDWSLPNIYGGEWNEKSADC